MIGVDPERNDSAIHRWYSTVMGFDPALVGQLIDRLSISEGQNLLDPFCGTGTTLVECQKKGITAIGLDVNPVCVLATRVKTNWQLSTDKIDSLLRLIVREARDIAKCPSLKSHKTYLHLLKSGMIRRGWISARKSIVVIALLEAIDRVCPKGFYLEFFHLAVASALVRKIADVKFGPELYCLKTRKRTRVISSFSHTVRSMSGDLKSISSSYDLSTRSKVMYGDARDCRTLISKAGTPTVDFLITSPPYPNEHDYTRTHRLELVFLKYVHSLEQLRMIKHSMIRCNTKSLYKGDCEERFIRAFPGIRKVSRTLDDRAQDRSDGFSKLYGRMIREYFGGMAVHLKSAYGSLTQGGHSAYVVADQQCFLGVHVDTPSILMKIATRPEIGFRHIETLEWRSLRGSTGNKTLHERVLIFRK